MCRLDSKKYRANVQDTLAARDQLPGSTSPPFDFSIDPGLNHSFIGGNLPAVNNSFYYHQASWTRAYTFAPSGSHSRIATESRTHSASPQIGNVGFIGFSGAYTVDELSPLFTEACAWLPTQARHPRRGPSDPPATTEAAVGVAAVATSIHDT